MQNIPTNIRHIHLIAVCGTGMGSLALLLQSRGFKVTGSDENIYPPMSTELEKNGIGILQGFVSKNLEPTPDLVIVGNAVSKDNPEVVALLEKKIPFLSMPQAISHFFLQNKRSIVVTGTHGKTTTSALLSHLLIQVGADPSFWFGGIFQDGLSPSPPPSPQREREMLKNYRLGEGDLFVVEGDEYDTAFFDKGPKFLHYQPFYTIITSLEFDHADIYRNIDHLASSFEALVKIVDPAGYLLLCADYPRLMKLHPHPDPLPSRERGITEEPPLPLPRRGPFGSGERAGVRGSGQLEVETYGLKENAMWRPVKIAHSPSETRFDLLRNGQKVFSFRSPMAGSHNVLNAIAAIALLHKLGYPFEKIQRGLLTFAGVKRRQEVRGIVNDIVVLDDFAHHPTAVRETIDAVRKKYAGHTLWAVFEPRSNTSRRAVFQKEFSEAFAGADHVILADVFEKRGTSPSPQPSPQRGEGVLDVDRLARDISSRGIEARHISGVEKIVEHLAGSVRPKSVVLIMSNGGFGGIQEKLIKKLHGLSLRAHAKQSS